MSNNAAKYEVLIKQYLRSILDISDNLLQLDPQITEPTRFGTVYYRYFRSEIYTRISKNPCVSQSGEVIFP